MGLFQTQPPGEGNCRIAKRLITFLRERSQEVPQWLIDVSEQPVALRKSRKGMGSISESAWSASGTAAEGVGAMAAGMAYPMGAPAAAASMAGVHTAERANTYAPRSDRLDHRGRGFGERQHGQHGQSMGPMGAPPHAHLASQGGGVGPQGPLGLQRFAQVPQPSHSSSFYGHQRNVGERGIGSREYGEPVRFGPREFNNFDSMGRMGGGQMGYRDHTGREQMHGQMAYGQMAYSQRTRMGKSGPHMGMHMQQEPPHMHMMRGGQMGAPMHMTAQMGGQMPMHAMGVRGAPQGHAAQAMPAMGYPQMHTPSPIDHTSQRVGGHREDPSQPSQMASGERSGQTSSQSSPRPPASPLPPDGTDDKHERKGRGNVHRRGSKRDSPTSDSPSADGFSTDSPTAAKSPTSPATAFESDQPAAGAAPASVSASATVPAQAPVQRQPVPAPVTPSPNPNRQPVPAPVTPSHDPHTRNVRRVSPAMQEGSQGRGMAHAQDQGQSQVQDQGRGQGYQTLEQQAVYPMDLTYLHTPDPEDPYPVVPFALVAGMHLGYGVGIHQTPPLVPVGFDSRKNLTMLGGQLVYNGDTNKYLSAFGRPSVVTP